MSDQPFTWQSSAITDVGKVRKLNELPVEKHSRGVFGPCQLVYD